MTAANGILDGSAIAEILAVASPLDRAAVARILPEKLGARLRRLARQAEYNNPLYRPPLTAPPAWAASVPYLKGDVVSNNGSWFVCVLAGTSAASGGPTNTTTGAPTQDNGAYWTYLGGALSTANDPDAPAITRTTGAPSDLGSNVIQPVNYPLAFRVYGATAEVERTLRWKLNTFNQSASAKANPGCAIGFVTDAPKFAICISQFSGPVRVIIDGRYYSWGALGGDLNAGDVWLKFDYSAKSARRPRHVVIEGNKDGLRFGGVHCTSSDRVWAPPTADDLRAVFISDSIMAGVNKGPWLPGGTVPSLVGKLLGWSDCWNMSHPSTGYIATNGGNSYTFGQRIAEALTRDPDIWVLMGSTNDLGNSPAAEAAALTAAISAIRASGSKAPIVVFGIWSVNSATIPSFETSMKAAIEALGDSRTIFIPICGDPQGPWISGAWNNQAFSQSNNAAVYLSDDNLHPSDIGTHYLAYCIARAIKTDVLPRL